MENKVFFKYKKHPGDLIRGTLVIEMPETGSNEFLTWFHPNYQGSQDICDLFDLYKIWNNEITDEDNGNQFINVNQKLSKEELETYIYTLEKKIELDSYKNFYRLIKNKKIEII